MSALSPRSDIQVSSVYPSYTHIKGQCPLCVCVCVCVCVRACVRACVRVCVCVLDLFVFKQQVLFRVDFFSVALDHRVQCPRVGLGVKI